MAWRPILTKDKSRWRKYFTKTQILKKLAFQQWLLRPRYCHGVFATWTFLVVCSKEGLPRGGHGTDTIRGSPTIYGLYRCSPSCISGLSHIIAAWRPILTKDKSRWRKLNTLQKNTLKKWAFQQWLLRPRYCHGVFATWILSVVCSKEGLPRGGHG